MYLTKLVLKDYRNFTALTLEDLKEGIYIFVGANAMGKTNLMEAMNYLSCGRSFRIMQERPLIKEGAPLAGILAEYETKSHRGTMETILLANGKRMIKVNGMPVRKIAEMMGVFHTVVFTPEDLRTIKESPSLRRRLLNVEISKISPSYYVDLQNYNTALKNKNKILKERNTNLSVLEAYNTALISHGSKVIHRRAIFVDHLNEFAQEIYETLVGQKESIAIRYDAAVGLDEIEKNFAEKILQMQKREIEMGMALVGPHREDMEILINGKDAKLYASQGQQRTAMLAIKLAAARIAEMFTGEKPILLLDDVFSELDHSRRTGLLSLVKEQQVFITSTDTALQNRYEYATYFEVKDGKVKKHI